jgi:EAL domain-containing protein (putative c-di-GMP-specific phosphodiesterase class I)
VHELLEAAYERGIQVIFKRVESQAVLDKLDELSKQAHREILVQGYFLDSPSSTLDT